MESMRVLVLLNELETARESLDRAFACLLPSPGITIGAEHTQNLAAGNANLVEPPIKLITENGFAIVRLCELGAGRSDSASECHFIVGGPKGGDRDVTVEFAEAAIQLLQRQQAKSKPLPLTSLFWLRCAERHLAAYLWERNEVPLGGRLVVDQLSVEDQCLARVRD